ncbi:hypothetical protein PHYBOEH_006664 [Phytophthora boehmeriae]|uniref:Origin recognition complex subunit 5 n=1 Tax=Phytophthora boehmeriae TaxID=109152 RepID=A0A8T1WGM8_9STRA|nr:hypothetical protein PHYBOEH_006664 [Phytophthora boehmeriae]
MIGRESQLSELARVAGLDGSESPAPLVVVYGGASTGKSVGVSRSLRSRSSAHALVDCTALYSAKEFYREALAQLYEKTSIEAQDTAESVRISIEEGDAIAADTGAKTNKRAVDEAEEDAKKISSLNFLSFFKALDAFMLQFAADTEDQGKRVLYLALDHVDKLLDRGLGALLTCICTINDQIAYLNMFEKTQPWEVCVLLITRGMSLDFDRLVMPFYPAYVHFPPYTAEQLADILVEQLEMQAAGDRFRAWLVHLHGLVPPAPDGDWIEFRSAVVHLLPEFRKAFFSSAASQDSKMKKKLEITTSRRVQIFLNTRRRHLFGYHKLGNSIGDPSELISCTNLSQNCLLLVLAGYLASFNPQETDVRFLSSSGGQRRKKRAKKHNADEAGTGSATSNKKLQISQLLVGPRIFTLQRLLAIYLNLRVEAEAGSSTIDRTNERSGSSETREEIFTHLATLVRMQLFQRTTPPHVLDNIKFRCLADARFVQETARYLSFPLDAYLNRAT